MINPMDLTGKRILVTGATGGIGEQTAFVLSKLGAKVVISGRNEEKLQQVFEKLEGEGHAKYVLDLNDTDSIEDSIKKIVIEQGIFSGFCHAAGIAPMRPLKMTKPFYLYLESEFKKNLEVGLDMEES